MKMIKSVNPESIESVISGLYLLSIVIYLPICMANEWNED